MSYQSLQTLSQIVIAIGLILTAIGGYGAYYYGRRIDEAKAVYDKILVTPAEIIIPAHASREVPIIITNNYPYPVFMVVVEIVVEEGDLDLSKDLVPFGNGIWQAKYVSCQIEQIKSKDAFTFFWHIDGSNYRNSSRVKLSVVKYLKVPAPDFIQHNVDSLPTEVELPDGFVPPMNDNK